MKSIIAAGLLLGCAHGAVAAPYANIENKAKFLGDEFSGAATEVHAGYKFDNGFAVQGGPIFYSPDGEAGYTEYSAKVKYSTKLSEDLKLYGEVSAVTNDQEFEFDALNIGTKVGLTFTF
jgi:outer membrane cobalamin receptor